MAVQSVVSDAPDTQGIALGETLREITRGGLAGLLVGVLLAGVGGRVVMRLVALLVPEATGRFTENGNRIGDITADGSASLVLFVGLFFGAVIGSFWVVLRPWLPERLSRRALATIPIALAIGTTALVLASNPDFATLDHDPRVVVLLLVYIALFGPALVLADAWLERRLPEARPGSAALATYGLITSVGVVVTLLAAVPATLGGRLWAVGLAMVVIGLATLRRWVLRSQGRPIPPAWLVTVARVAIVAMVAVGVIVAIPEVTGALDLD
jgi:hypothetical protein